MKKFLARFSIVASFGILLAIPALAWLSTPIEVLSHDTGNCLYQLQTTQFGLGDSVQVPCGTFGKLAVARISDLHL